MVSAMFQIVHRLTAKAIIQDWEAGFLSDDRTHHEVGILLFSQTRHC